MEKIVKLQKANKEFQHEQQVLECRVRTLESWVCTLEQEKRVNPVSVEAALDEASGGCSQTTSGGSILEKKRKEEAQQPASRPMPGPGLHYLENLCKTMEKIAKLQKANLEIHHKCLILECRVCTLEEEKKVQSLWGRLKGLFMKRRRGSLKPEEVIQVTVTSHTSSDTSSQSRNSWKPRSSFVLYLSELDRNWMGETASMAVEDWTM
ncbi:PREDICTED: uncharacterized protein LOC106547254 [Thamnophis sirtalis]|uniref:Uncharacterized protein LOC106547254 n=1 Tax=Thamnophis sirtalis TaxID=35019 RepID=A0A6I9Y0K0_9SAUR|nr:PREDICTED: uncharacterized protein LOC106547254 [Thamnophis sirtalis]